MKKLVAGCVIICVLSFLVVGCDAKDTGQKDIISAMQIDDGAEKYRQMQFRCPVCGQKGIKPEYHASVDGKRIYFDRRKCMEKFKKNPGKYLEKYKKMLQESLGQRQRSK